MKEYAATDAKSAAANPDIANNEWSNLKPNDVGLGNAQLASMASGVGPGGIILDSTNQVFADALAPDQMK